MEELIQHADDISELFEKWHKIRFVRRVVTGALEIERREKRIGSSLEAAPIVYIEDKELLALVSSCRQMRLLPVSLACQPYSAHLDELWPPG